MKRPAGWLALVLLAGLTSCGTESPGIEVPSDATFCSVFVSEYRDALASAVPITDSDFADSAARIVAWAEVLVGLVPEEIEPLVLDNLEYHKAQAAMRSAAEFIPGSNAMHEWGNSNC